MFYLDSSALVKRYVMERGSIWLRAQLPNGFIVATIAFAEVSSALARRLKGGTLSAHDYTQAKTMFEFDMDYRFALVEVNKALCRRAGQLAEKHALRGYDSLQLACAIHTDHQMRQIGQGPITFLVADNNLLQAGVAEGLLVDNPENYPP